MPLVSDNWALHFKWKGKGPISEAERKKLDDAVAKAHAHGRRIRFWATPDDAVDVARAAGGRRRHDQHRRPGRGWKRSCADARQYQPEPTSLQEISRWSIVPRSPHRPADDLDQWEDDLRRRYPEPVNELAPNRPRPRSSFATIGPKPSPRSRSSIG